jgi:hypothetical protein
VTCLRFAFFFSCFTALAGTNPTLTAAQSDFKKVNQSYVNTPNMSMNTYYRVYSEHDSQSLLEGKSGKYIKYGKNTYTKIDDIEMLAMGDKLISINKDSKLISVGDNKELVLEPMQNNMDSLLRICSEIKVEQINANEKSYQLYFNPSDVTEFSRVDVHIDTQNYRYLKLVLYYAMQINLKSDFYAEEKQPRMEITYSNFTILKTQPALFNEALYISYNKNKLMPGAGYGNYNVSDLRNKTRIKTR